MTSLLLLKVFAVFVLVLLNGFFVAAEFALVKIRDTQLQSLIDKGNRQAKQLVVPNDTEKDNNGNASKKDENLVVPLAEPRR